MNQFSLPPSRFRMLRFLESMVRPAQRKDDVEPEMDLSILKFKYTIFLNENSLVLSKFDVRHMMFDFCITDGKKVIGYMVHAQHFNCQNIY